MIKCYLNFFGLFLLNGLLTTMTKRHSGTILVRYSAEAAADAPPCPSPSRDLGGKRGGTTDERDGRAQRTSATDEGGGKNAGTTPRLTSAAAGGAADERGDDVIMASRRHGGDAGRPTDERRRARRWGA